MTNHAFFLITITAVVLLTGCGSTPQPQREVGTINFVYTPQPATQNTDKIVAIVSPTYKSNNVTKAPAANNNSLIAMAIAQQQQQSNRYMVDFNEYLGQYQNRLLSAMDSAFNEIVISKGFNFSGPYGNFDDITYGDKKSSYLALTPDLEVYIDQKRISYECSASENYCEDVGTIQVGGSLTIKLIEPMTKQTFLSKRVNLSEISQSQDYVKRVHYKGPQQGLLVSAIGAAIDAASEDAGDKPLIDNTDKVLATVLNEFYAKAMFKVDSYLSTEEILSFEEDVAKVKGLKRF